MMCHNLERRGSGFADVDAWRWHNSLDPIKPRAVGVVLVQQPTCHLSTDFLYTHYVSYQQPHFWTFYGAPDLVWRCLVPPSYQWWSTLSVEPTGKVLYRFGLTNLTGVLVTGGRGGVTQGVNWEFDQRKPTYIPLSHSLKKPLGFFHKLVQNMPTICLSHSSRVLS